MSEEWRNFDDKAKKQYEKMEEKERERYEKEKNEYDAKKAAEATKGPKKTDKKA